MPAPSASTTSAGTSKPMAVLPFCWIVVRKRTLSTRIWRSGGRPGARPDAAVRSVDCSTPRGSTLVGGTCRSPTKVITATTTDSTTLIRPRPACRRRTTGVRPRGAPPRRPGSCGDARPRRACRGRPRRPRPGRGGQRRRRPAPGRSRRRCCPGSRSRARHRARAPVSEMPEAAPARSGGAEPTISSVVRPNTGARPSEMTTERDHDHGQAVRRRRPGSAREPTAASARPPPIRYAGRTTRTIRGAALEPMMKPIADGSDTGRPGAATGRAPAAGTGPRRGSSRPRRRSRGS